VKIVIVSAFFSQGMGYSENCLSRALARRGHEVHVVTSTYNVYGNEPLYDQTYREFLGPRQLAAGTTQSDGFRVHRLPTRLVGGYVRLDGLAKMVRELGPDIVHSLEVASVPTFELAAWKPFARYKLFCETHQTLSVIKPYMRQAGGAWLRRAGYRATRTLPSYLASLAIERCYAVTPDCAEVARRFYGVPDAKLRVLSLGVDTETFHPSAEASEHAARTELRERLGFEADDIVCVYTGRFSADKNPLVLARAIDALQGSTPRFKGLFIGNGVQRDAIGACRGVTMRPFMTHDELAQHYRAADIAVWPRQESMSMLDAAASGLPVIVSNRIGEPGRVSGNGKMYEENDVESLMEVIRTFADESERRGLGDAGRARMVNGFTWTRFAAVVEADFEAALGVAQQR
jgi:glycosyltransferase involved in cell wall biosynthesis